MTPALHARQFFQEWANSAEGYSSILQFAKRKLIYQRSGGSLTAVWPYRRWQDCDYENQLDLTEEVGHDFLTFILSTILSQLEKQPVLTHKLLTGHYQFFLDHCWHMFIWEWQEKARNKNLNPLGYLYRRFRETLANNAAFETIRATNGILFYSLKKQKQTSDINVINTLAGESYQGWPLPQDHIPRTTDTKGLKVTTKWLVDTALFFWHHAKSLDQNIEWLAVKEVTRYLGTVFPWLNTPRIASHSVSSNNDTSPLELIPAHREEEESRLDRLSQLQAIDPLVLQLVCGWDRDECCIFAWRLKDVPLSFEKIAALLDMKSHNQAFALFKKTEKSLKFFCNNWPGPPSEDLAENVFLFFIEKVKEQAKKVCGRP